LKTKVTIGCLLCQVLASYLPADPGSAQTILDRLRTADARVSAAQSLKVRYVRTDEYPGPYQDLWQTGTVLLAKPGNVRHEITRARRIDAKDAWKDTGNNTLTVYNERGYTYAFFHPHSVQVRQSEVTKGTIDDVPIVSAFFGGRTAPSAVLAQAIQDGTVEDISETATQASYRIRDVTTTVTFRPDGSIGEFVQQNRASGTVRRWVVERVEWDAKLATNAFDYRPPSYALPFDDRERSTLLAVGSEAPNITVQGTDGRTVNLADYRGKVVILEFFATWCWPCNQSMPHLNKVAESEGAVALAVAIKGSKKDFDVWTKKHRSFGNVQFTYEIPESTTASSLYRVAATPTTYVIDASGRISSAWTGYTGPTPVLATAVQSAR